MPKRKKLQPNRKCKGHMQDCDTASMETPIKMHVWSGLKKPVYKAQGEHAESTQTDSAWN